MDDGAVQAGTHARLNSRVFDGAGNFSDFVLWDQRHGPGENHTISSGFSRADAVTLDNTGSAVLYGNNNPISGQDNCRVSLE